VYPPGLSVSITWSPQDPTPGWTVGGTTIFGGIAGQYGYGFGEGGGQFGEIGVAYPPVGVSLTEYYVSKPWRWPWKRDWCAWRDKKK